MSEAPILCEKRGALGLVTLNRPAALNAFSRRMTQTMTAALDAWAADSGVRAVAIRGAGRAFCAGGDVRALAEGVRAEGETAAGFLADEYRLNARIAEYPKPYAALCHGYVMGGGAGLSVHGKYRLADASLAFAMPEIAIGFVPDVGATYFLARCPGHAGLYLGLTGARIGAGDALALGLMTGTVAAADFEAVIEALAAGEAAAAAIARFAQAAPPSPLAAHRRRIDAIFSAPTVEAVFERLERDGGDFAMQAARAMRAGSPSSLKFTFRAIRAGAGLTLRDCLKMEYRIAAHAILRHDFSEGIRAQLVDKDRNPRWIPPQLAALDDASVAAYFAEPPGGDLSFSEPSPS